MFVTHKMLLFILWKNQERECRKNGGRNPKNEAEFEMQEKPNKRPIVQQGKTETASATSLIWFILFAK